MNSLLNWQDFLDQAKLPSDADCLQTTAPMHALVRVTGSDAASFLHAQLSNSVTGMQAGETRFAAWCNAKGRVWTLLHYWQDGDAIILRMPADQLEDTLKRMRMFVLRSDVQLEPLDWQAIQFLGPEAETRAMQCIESSEDRSYHLTLPGAWPWHEVWSAAPQHNSELAELPQELLALPRILAGQPEVFAGQREQWIPQMLNLDQLDGVDFKKGCYPGQEIVAKLHYKGGLKQRMFPGSIENCRARPDNGAEVFNTGDKKVGHVVEACLLGNLCYLTTVIRLESEDEPLYIDGQAVNITGNAS